MIALAGLHKQFIFDRGFAPIPGWDLSVTWLTEEGFPKKGLLSFEFFAGDGLQLLGCKVDLPLRTVLSSLVLADQRDYWAEIAAGDAALHDEEQTDRPVRAVEKLQRQRGLICKLNSYEEEDGPVPRLQRQCADDANHHLANHTDITWNYTADNSGKFESWVTE